MIDPLGWDWEYTDADPPYNGPTEYPWYRTWAPPLLVVCFFILSWFLILSRSS